MTDDWTEQEIKNDFADLHGSVPYSEIIDDRREAFRHWLAGHDAELRKENSETFLRLYWAEHLLENLGWNWDEESGDYT